MYWREYLVLFSLAAVLAHASPGQDAGAALANANPSGGLIVSTFMIKGKPMTATVVGSRAEPTPNVQDSKIYFPVVGPNNIDDPLYNPCARMVKVRLSSQAEAKPFRTEIHLTRGLESRPKD